MNIEINCPHCKKRITFDGGDMADYDEYEPHVMHECPSCQTTYVFVIVWQPIVAQAFSLQPVELEEAA